MYKSGTYTNPFGVTIRINKVSEGRRHVTFLKHHFIKCPFDSWESVETLREYGYVED